MKIEKGFYKHSTGGIYQVLQQSTNIETDEELVLYKNEKGEFFSCPVEMFLDVYKYEPIMVNVIKTKYGYIGKFDFVGDAEHLYLASSLNFTGIKDAQPFQPQDDRYEHLISKFLKEFSGIGAVVEKVHLKLGEWNG